MAKTSRNEELLKLMNGYQAACVLGAAAELDVFSLLSKKALPAGEAAKKLDADPRGIAALLDALAALRLLKKSGARYSVPKDLAAALSEDSKTNVLAMIRHSMSCLRSWSDLASAVKTGQPVPRRASIRGAEADRAAFLLAMDNISAPLAPAVVSRLKKVKFKHLLDVGGASGTWTVAFLKTAPDATATLFDLPDALPHAARRMEANGLSERVTLAAGDFYKDRLPVGADCAWVSAIVHQNSRGQNRELFKKVFAALNAGGCILIRDVVLAPSRIAPVAGALFALNMLVHTPLGGTFTFAELDDDLRRAGFGKVRQLLSDPFMSSVVLARKP